MHGFRFNVRFNEPYYGGGGSSTITPHIAECAVGGHSYMIDWKSEMPLRHVSIPILRQQQDVSESPGEQSINAEGLWRRFGESWHLGAGQERYDRKESNQFRFHRSQGVNVWNKWELSLLHDVELIDGDVATNQKLVVAGTYLYYSQGQVLKYTGSLAGAPTTVAGTPAANIVSMASDGFHIWTAHTGANIYKTDRNTAGSALHITGNVTLLAYVKNRVMAANGRVIYDITALAMGAGGALPAAFFTHANTDWNWVAFAESQAFIYAAGYSGDKSLIYSLGITTDGTALSQPVVAGTLPDGEIVTGLYGYLGRFLAVGTNKGFRLALASDTGGLTIGSLVETPASVTCFEGQDSFIWYNLTNFDSITTAQATGLGRMNTAGFTDIDNFVPAYASDLMVTGEADPVTDIVTFEGKRVFAVDTLGIYAEHSTDLVPSGAVDTGAISYGMTEPKTALFVDLQIDQNGSDDPITVSMAVDDETFTPLGTYTADLMETYFAGESVGNEFELRITLNSDVGDPSIAPLLLSWLLRSQVRPLITNLIFVTVLINVTVVDLQGNYIDYSTDDELDFIENLNRTKQVITFQRNDRLYSVVLEDYELNVYQLIEDTDGNSGFNASCLLKLKRI